MFPHASLAHAAAAGELMKLLRNQIHMLTHQRSFMFLCFSPPCYLCAAPAGELMKLLRNLRRAVENPTNSGMLKELQDILAIAVKHEGDAAAG
jgi:hypothetical protein